VIQNVICRSKLSIDATVFFCVMSESCPYSDFNPDEVISFQGSLQKYPIRESSGIERAFPLFPLFLQFLSRFYVIVGLFDDEKLISKMFGKSRPDRGELRKFENENLILS
jgi:hypothetical protein